MKTDPIIYHDPELGQRHLRRGDLLVASPFMTEEVFSHSVILLLDVGKDNGCLGLALNKKSSFTLQDLFPALKDIDPIDVFCGGPVGLNRLFILHNLPDLFTDSMEVAPGVSVGGDPDKIVNYLLTGGELKNNIRFFLGYSGWNGGQLPEEIENHYWTVTPAIQGDDLLSGRGVKYWRSVVQSLGPYYRGWLNVPRDPAMN